MVERSTYHFYERAIRDPVLSHRDHPGSRRQQNRHSQTQAGRRKTTLPMITNEVAFIAIAVSDKERARKFYQETLELKPTTTGMEGAWAEYELGATTIGVGCHPAWKPSRDGTTVAFEVSDIHDVVQKLKSRGVEFEGET